MTVCVCQNSQKTSLLKVVNAIICTSVSLTLKEAVTTEMPREAQPAHHMTAALGTTPHCFSTTLPVGKTQSSRPDVKHVRSTIGLGITAAKRRTPESHFNTVQFPKPQYPVTSKCPQAGLPKEWRAAQCMGHQASAAQGP